MELIWQTSLAVSCFHAAEAVFRGRSLADPALVQTLTGPVDKLRIACQEEQVPVETFWAQVIPQGAAITGMRELAEVVLIKTVGKSETPIRLRRFHDLLLEIKNGFLSAMPHPEETLASRLGPLKQAWDYQGAGLLGGVRNLTEVDFLVEQASVIVVYPVQGGGGTAHPRSNLVCLEGVEPDLHPDLPEVVRLAWLLSQLNLDLPAYSEGLTSQQPEKLWALAMIPPTLSAAEIIPLARCDEPTIALAIRYWIDPGLEADNLADLLAQWWEVYHTMRPPWATALAGLDRLLGEQAQT